MDPHKLTTDTHVIFWLIGFSLSVVGLIFQILLYVLIPASRKLDQKILTQMTVARLMNVVFEYLVTTATFPDAKIRDPVYALYFQTDAALICWMFVFTKNLYDKVIHVFALKKVGFTILSVTIWIVTFPLGLLCPLLLSINSEYFFKLYYVYGIAKFIVLTLNLLFFGRIFYIAITRQDRSVNIVRTCVVSFILFSITSFQVYLTDLLSYFCTKEDVDLVFCVINSYQVIAITIIFTILVDGACEETLAKTISKKFMKATV